MRYLVTSTMSRSLSVFVRSLHTSRLLHKRGPLTIDGWYPRDHKPNDYPKTEKERRAAAIKYGLRPEDYKPIDPDDAFRYAGEYPDFGKVTYDHKDPYESWSDPLYRRNWGEPVDIQAVMHTADRDSYNSLNDEELAIWTNAVILCRHVIPMLLFAWFCIQSWPKGGKRYKDDKMMKQYPYDFKRAYPFTDPREYPIVNYTFEPLDAQLE